MSELIPDATDVTSDVLPAIRKRRSARAFRPDPVPPEALWRIFEAARWAPSGGNGQPWRFIVSRRGTPGFDALAEALKPGNVWAKEAPLLVLAVTRRVHLHPTKPPRENRDARLDLGLALGQAFVQAAAEGLTAHAMGGIHLDVAAEAVGLQDPYEVGVMVALGYAADPENLDSSLQAREGKPRTRLPLDVIVMEDRFVSDVQA